MIKRINATAPIRVCDNGGWTLISPEADQIIELAKQFGAMGWKVNGAGGNGGSLSINKKLVQKRGPFLQTDDSIPYLI